MGTRGPRSAPPHPGSRSAPPHPGPRRPASRRHAPRPVQAAPGFRAPLGGGTAFAARVAQHSRPGAGQPSAPRFPPCRPPPGAGGGFRRYHDGQRLRMERRQPPVTSPAAQLHGSRHLVRRQRGPGERAAAAFAWRRSSAPGSAAGREKRLELLGDRWPSLA